MIRRILILSVLIFISVLHINAQRSKGTLSIAFEHSVDSLPLVLDSAIFENALGQEYTITKFKYYISGISLLRADKKEIILPGFFLIDEENPVSKKIILKNVPEGKYVSLAFIIGVDSIHNCRGAQSGSLDPVNGMFWAWNTGYIFLKLEGKAPTSTAPGKIFEYHIGGYRFPNNCIRSVVLKTDSIKIEKSKNKELTIHVNAAEVLRTPDAVDFSKLPSVTDHHHATDIADNYMDMFSIGK